MSKVHVSLHLSIVLPIAWGIVNEELARAGWVLTDPVTAVVVTIIAGVSAAAGLYDVASRDTYIPERAEAELDSTI